MLSWTKGVKSRIAWLPHHVFGDHSIHTPSSKDEILILAFARSWASADAPTLGVSVSLRGIKWKCAGPVETILDTSITSLASYRCSSHRGGPGVAWPRASVNNFTLGIGISLWGVKREGSGLIETGLDTIEACRADQRSCSRCDIGAITWLSASINDLALSIGEPVCCKKRRWLGLFKTRLNAIVTGSAL